MLSRAEFGRKLTALTADGAPVMGTGRSGAPVHEPKAGQNLAAALQDVKAECGDEKLLVVPSVRFGGETRFDLIQFLLVYEVTTQGMIFFWSAAS